MKKFQSSTENTAVSGQEIAPIITEQTIEAIPDNRVVSSFIMDGDPDSQIIVLKIVFSDDTIEHYQMSGTTIHMLEEYIAHPFNDRTFNDTRVDAGIEHQDEITQDYMYSLPEAIETRYFENEYKEAILTSFTCMILEDGFAIAIKTMDKQTHHFLIAEQTAVFFLDFIKELKPHFKDLRTK